MGRTHNALRLPTMPCDATPPTLPPCRCAGAPGPGGRGPPPRPDPSPPPEDGSLEPFLAPPARAAAPSRADFLISSTSSVLRGLRGWRSRLLGPRGPLSRRRPLQPLPLPPSNLSPQSRRGAASASPVGFTRPPTRELIPDRGLLFFENRFLGLRRRGHPTPARPFFGPTRVLREKKDHHSEKVLTNPTFSESYRSWLSKKGQERSEELEWRKLFEETVPHPQI